METLLDSSLQDEEFVSLLDHTIRIMYTSSQENERNAAQSVLTRLQEGPDAWARADKVLNHAQASSASKFYALQLLNDMIKYRWQVLPRDVREAVRSFVVSKVVELSATEDLVRNEREYIGKLNLCLVQIVKQDWPMHWQSFMSDIVASSKTSVSRCENNLRILALLSEEVFQFSADELTHSKALSLKEQFITEFGQVFELCQFVLQQVDGLVGAHPELLLTTLDTLHKFLAWIPLHYIFDSLLIDVLVSLLSASPALRGASMLCITDIASLHTPSMYNDAYRALHDGVIDKLRAILPADVDVAAEYDHADVDTQTFVLQVAMYITLMLRRHLYALRSPNGELFPSAKVSLEYELRITKVDDTEVRKACTELWQQYTKSLLLAKQAAEEADVANLAGSRGGDVASLSARVGLHNAFVQWLLAELRATLLEHMPRPEEVLLVRDDSGELLRESRQDTHNVALYKLVRATLVNLTELAPAQMERIVLERLHEVLKAAHLCPEALESLCWAVGSISGAMSADEEARFLTVFVSKLLRLSMLKGYGEEGGHHALISSYVLYVVGQYPRFLRSHYDFLQAVVVVLFQYMAESHPHIKEMACDTFFKVARSCDLQLVSAPPSSPASAPLIARVLEQLPPLAATLEARQMHRLYAACGSAIARVSDDGAREALVERLFEAPNAAWRQLLSRAYPSTPSMAPHDADFLSDRATMRALTALLQTHKSVTEQMGDAVAAQFAAVFPDMLRLYSSYSQLVGGLVRERGDAMAMSADGRAMRAIRREILRSVQAFIAPLTPGGAAVAEDGGGGPPAAATVPTPRAVHLMPQSVWTSTLQPLMEVVLREYAHSAAALRQAEVVELFARVVQYMDGVSVAALRFIYATLWTPTLEMLRGSFEEHPDLRVGFFELLRAMVGHNFVELFRLEDDAAAAEREFVRVVQAALWALQHTERTASDTGLRVLLSLLQNVSRSSYRDYFYLTCFRSVLRDVLQVMTDTLHRPGFQLQAQLLQLLLHTASVEVGEPLWDGDDTEEREAAGLPPSNAEFVRVHLHRLLLGAFPNITRAQMGRVIDEMFRRLDNVAEFRAQLRDFLLQTKEFRAGDNTDLYDADRAVTEIELD